MKITMYELLGLVKDGKAPKTIKCGGHYYHYDAFEKDYYEGMGYDYEYLLANTSIKGIYNEIEIIEENKIPEKLDLQYKDVIYNPNFKEEILMYCDNLQHKLNQIIDYLHYLKSKGE